jgi:hypothetical protein
MFQLRVPPVLISPTKEVVSVVTLENTTAKPARQVAPIVQLENTVSYSARQVQIVAEAGVLPGIMPTKRTYVRHVQLENTAHMVRSVVIIIALRVLPVLIPTALDVVTHVRLENTTYKPAKEVQQVAPIAGLEHTVQLVRPLAPSVRMVNSIPAQENNNVLNAPQVK